MFHATRFAAGLLPDDGEPTCATICSCQLERSALCAGEHCEPMRPTTRRQELLARIGFASAFAERARCKPNFGVASASER